MNEIISTRSPIIKSRDLLEAIENCAMDRFFVTNEEWLEKCVQLYYVLSVNHGVILLGDSGSGKSSIIRCLFAAIQKVDQKVGRLFYFDAKIIKKNNLYGSLNETTREWTDGIFTKTLREISNNFIDTINWIVFDGDMDPEWVENLNSLLDDNRLLTLPHGERIPLLSNTRILFEATNLRHVTPATVSRCGIISIPNNVLPDSSICDRFIKMLRSIPVHELPNSYDFAKSDYTFSLTSSIQAEAVEMLESQISSGMIEYTFDAVQEFKQILPHNKMQLLLNAFTLVIGGLKALIDYQFNEKAGDLLELDIISTHVKHTFAISLLWSVASGLNEEYRKFLGFNLSNNFNILVKGCAVDLFDYYWSLEHQELISFESCIPKFYISRYNLQRHDAMIPTVDTIRNEKLISSWVHERHPVILCGPPGSGKVFSINADNDIAIVVAKIRKYFNSVIKFFQ